MNRSEKRFAKVDSAFEFLVSKEETKQAFTPGDLARAVGWNSSSVATYIAKRWVRQLARAKEGGYLVSGVKSLGRDGFRKLHSQTARVSDAGTDVLLRKAREFALLAVSMYNNPYSSFKTYGYIVNLIIAWTSLFHAIFQKKGIDYFYRDKNGTPIVIDGEEKAFELSQCVDLHWAGTQDPVKANLIFLIGLRNKIEHRGLPAIDLAVAGECQASLTNFERLLVEEFGDAYSINADLAISLQLSRRSSDAQIQALKQLQSENYRVVKQYIDDYRNGLSDSIRESQDFRISVFLIPKLKNHAKAADLCVEFINVNALSEEEIGEYERLVAFVKGSDSPYRYRPTNVVAEVKKTVGAFNTSLHTNAWKLYNARPKEENRKFRGRYAGWVEGHEGYLYSRAWIEFLLGKLMSADELARVKAYRN